MARDHIFISYRWTEPDQTWVRDHLCPALRAAGLKVILDVEDFVPGRDLIREMTRAHDQSDHLLCVISPDYFDGDRMVHFESLMRRRSDPSGSRSALIPLIVRPSNLPEWMSGLIPVDWTSSDKDRRREWKKLLEVLGAPRRTVAAPPAVQPPGDVSANVKVRNLPEKGAPPPASLIELPSSLAKDYRVVQKLADTSLSTLFAVEDQRRKRYLVKRIKRKEHYRPEWLEQIARIYRSSRVGDHVVLPETVAEDRDAFYELLEFVEGWTVNQVMSSPGQVGIFGRLLEDWVGQLLSLITPLHEADFIHRDISPYNVMISAKDLSLMLIDFSSAAPIDQAREVPALFCPGFSAPEQHEGQYGTFTDVYSVGALIYYLNTATSPPTYEDRNYRSKAITLKGRMYHRLTDVMERMLTLNPADRLQTAPDVSRETQRSGSTEVYDASERAVLRLPPPGGEIGMGYHRYYWRRPE